MLKVGITGGIGSGKTMVCRIFEVLGIPIYYADFHAKRLMETDPGIKQELAKLFGPSVVIQGKINKENLARIIFNNSDALRSVNSLVHPSVRKDFIGWANKMSEHFYIIEEAAILFESGAYKLLDFNITVSAPEEMRIKRVMERDHTTREAVLSRISKQMTEQERNSIADAVIFNDESEFLIPQVITLHNKLIELAGNQSIKTKF
jgi:dephospho-CoA kinase